MVYAFCLEIPNWDEFIIESEGFLYLLVEACYSIAPDLEPTVVLVPKILRQHIEVLTAKVGFDEQTLSYLLGLFLCYPFGCIMKALPYGTARHVASFLFGVFLLQFVLNIQWIHHCITCSIVYVYLYVFPTSWNIKLVPIFLFSYLVLGHIHRQYTNYLGYDLDFTITQMILTQKLYMITYNLYDGDVLRSIDTTTTTTTTTNNNNKNNKTTVTTADDDGMSNGTKENSNNTTISNNNNSNNNKEYTPDIIRASKKCQEYALYELPSILEYLGYTFCFANLLAGPAYEFTVYRKTCDGSLLYTDVGARVPRGKIPSSVGPTMRPFLVSILSLGLYLVGSKHFPIMDPDEPQYKTPVILTERFLSKVWIYRYAYLWIGLFVMRFKYYFAWKNAEGANNIWYAGFDGFDPKTGEPRGWENCTNLHILKVETASNLQTLSKEWNRKTSLWLTKYIYIRTGGSLFAVYSLAALWHGLYPGYFLFFLSIPLVTICERIGRKKISPIYSSLKYYSNICTFATFFVMVYMASPFPLLALSWSWENWKHHYFFGHIGCILFYIYAYKLPKAKSPDLSKESSSIESSDGTEKITVVTSSPSHRRNKSTDSKDDDETRPFLSTDEDKRL